MNTLLSIGKTIRSCRFFKGIAVFFLFAAVIGISVFHDQLTAFAVGEKTSAYLRYYNNGSYVSISVYWDDTGGGSSVHWADDVVSSGAGLDWQDSDFSISGLGTGNAVATLSEAEKYKNYYFELVKGGETTIIRAFPVDFANGPGTRSQNDYAHGNFTPDTSMCAECHSTHAALKAQLLREASYYELCMLCHGNPTSQSKYDVQRGMVYMGPGYGVAGWVYSPAGPIAAGFSGHNVDDSAGNTSTEVYGSDLDQTLTFTCVSCHNAHGGTNDNYRLLKKTIYPANNWNPQTVNVAAYAVVKDFSVGEEVYMVSGNTEFCSACHLDYDEGNAGSKGGTYGEAAYYRHPVTIGSTVYSVETKNYWPTAGDNLPLQYYSGASSTDRRTAVVCETCHFAHGSYKNFNITLPDGTVIADQKMLRLDNYGVCQSCHKK